MQGEKFRQLELMGGLNQGAAVWHSASSEWFSTGAMADNELVLADNVFVNHDGELRKRPGYSKLNAVEITGSSGIRGLYRYYHQVSGTTTGKTITASGTNLYIASGDTAPATFSKITFTDTSRGTSGNDYFTTGKEWQFATIANAVYGVNGKERPVRYGPAASGALNTVYLRDYGCTNHMATPPTMVATDKTSGVGPSAGEWTYGITYLFDTGEESYLIEAATLNVQYTQDASQHSVVLTFVPDLLDAPTGYGVTGLRLYRAPGALHTDGRYRYWVTSGPWRYVKDIPSTGNTVTDDVTDDLLGAELAYQNYAAMENMDELTSTAGAYCVAAHANRLFFARNNTYPSRLWYSEDGLPNTRYPDNWMDVSLDDGDYITHIASLNEVLVIFKTNSVWALMGTGPTTWALRQVIAGIGCVGLRAATQVDNAIVFAGKDGLYAFDGVTVRPAPPTIKQSIAGTDTGDDAYITLGYCQRRLFASLNDTNFGVTDYGGRHGACFTRSMDFGGWSRWRSHTTGEGLEWSCFSAWNGASDGNRFFAGASRDGFVYELLDETVYKDDEPATDDQYIAVNIQTKSFGFGEPETPKQYRRVWVHCRISGNYYVYLNWRVDDGDWQSEHLKALSEGDSDNEMLMKFVVPARGRSLALWISDVPKDWVPGAKTTPNTFRVYGVAVEYRPKKAK